MCVLLITSRRVSHIHYHLKALCRHLDSVVLFEPLLIALTYVKSSLAPPGTQTSFLGLVTLPGMYEPYMMVFIRLLVGGPAKAASGVIGLIVGHCWWWSVFERLGRRDFLERWAKAPTWMKIFVSDELPGAAPSGGVYVTAPRPRAGMPGGSASTTGYRWGSGQRLGGS